MHAFASRRAVVFGGGTGTGAEISRRLRQAGAFVSAVDRRIDPQLEQASDLMLDLTDGPAAAVVDQVTERLSDLPTLVVWNAAYQSLRSFLDSDEIDLLVSLRTNIVAPHNILSCLAQRLVDAGLSASVVLVLSLHASEVRGAPAYSGAKAYLEMLVREAAYELAFHDIRVNGVSPGIISMPSSSEVRNPNKATVTPGSVASVVMALLDSSVTGSVTGVNVAVDGGLSLSNWVTMESNAVGRLPPDRDTHQS